MKKPRKPRLCRPHFGRVLGVLCDMDGTLLETEKLLYEAWCILAARYGADFGTFDYGGIIGKRDLECCGIVARHFGWDKEPAPLHAEYMLIVRSLMLTGSLRMRPGARAFLRSLKKSGIRSALVTSGGNEHVAIAHHLFGILDYFDKAVTASSEGLRRFKPAPDPYQMAAGLLRVPVRRCLAIEDSPSGVLSASRAGAYVVAVPHDHSPAIGLGKAHCIVQQIDQALPVILGS